MINNVEFNFLSLTSKNLETAGSLACNKPVLFNSTPETAGSIASSSSSSSSTVAVA